MTRDLQAPVAASRFNFAQYLIELNASHPDRVAYVDDAGVLTYGELADRIRRMAAALCALGLRREERVLLVMQDDCDWPVSFLGAMYAGIVPVAVNTLLTADDYAYLLEHSQSRAVLVSGAVLPALAAAMSRSDHNVHHVIVSRPIAPLQALEVEFDACLGAQTPAPTPAATGPDDHAFWLYSSGSTGRPKAAVHSHANPYWTIELYAKAVLGLQPDDVCFSAAKLYFAYGLGNALTSPLAVGATTVLMAERATPEAVFRRLTGEAGNPRPTIYFGAPTGYAGLLAHSKLPQRDDLALRLASSAGEALPADIGRRFKQHFGVDIIDGIGSTEMLHIYISNRPGQVRYGTTGWPVPGYQIELRDERGQPVPVGELGEVYIQGPSSALFYWGNRAKSSETFLGAWTRSGDKYVLNDDGTYTYGGRSDDMLKVSGTYVSPFEVEATLVQHPAVLEAAVIGVADVDGLTKTKAFVVLKPGQSVDAVSLSAFVKERLAPYKYPRRIEFVTELPKTATGKIQRYKLRQMESGAT